MTIDETANRLLATRLAAIVEEVSATADPDAAEALWKGADRLLAEVEAEEEAELALPVWDRDLEAVRALMAAWASGAAPYSGHDKALLKRAFKAFKKRLKLARLDDESTAGANPLSAGRESSILGVRAPEQYPDEVWAVLVAQGKLTDAGGGIHELATG